MNVNIFTYVNLFQAEELLQVAQVEIDKRHNLIMKLHANSNQMIDEYKNIELQKKCKGNFFRNLKIFEPGRPGPGSFSIVSEIEW